MSAASPRSSREPQTRRGDDRRLPERRAGDSAVFAVEYLPGQFDQRADSASECIQLISQGERPAVRTATVYVLEGDLTEEDVAAVKHYVDQPRRGARGLARARATRCARTTPSPPTSRCSTASLELSTTRSWRPSSTSAAWPWTWRTSPSARSYFARRGARAHDHRDPHDRHLLVRPLPSHHLRHRPSTRCSSTTRSCSAAFDRYLDMRHELGRDDQRRHASWTWAPSAPSTSRSTGQLTNLDESEEINACTVKVKVDVDGEQRGLAASSSRTRRTTTRPRSSPSAARPPASAAPSATRSPAAATSTRPCASPAPPTRTVPVDETLPGKLPQRKLVTTAAAGYSSLRQPDRPGHGPGATSSTTPATPPSAWRSARSWAPPPPSTCAARRPAPGDIDHPARRPHGPRRHAAARPAPPRPTTSSRSRPAARRCRRATPPDRAQAPAPLPPRGRVPAHQALQRLWRGRRVRCHRRARRRPGHQPRPRAQEVRGPRRHRARHLREPGAHGRGRRARGRRRVPRATRTRRTSRPPSSPTVTDEPRAAHELARRRRSWTCRREFLDSNGAPKSRSTCDVTAAARTTSRSWAGETLRRAACDALVHRPQRLPPTRASSERFDSTIGAATVLMPFGGSTQLTPAHGHGRQAPR